MIGYFLFPAPHGGAGTPRAGPSAAPALKLAQMPSTWTMSGWPARTGVRDPPATANRRASARP